MPPFERTAQQLLRARAEEHPDEPAFVFVTDGEQQVTTYGELRAAADRVAAALYAHGVGPGDHVAILMANRPEFVALTYGTLQAGAVVNPYNAMWGAEELGEVLRRADPAVLVTTARDGGSDHLGLLSEALPDLEGTADGGVDSAAVPTLEHVVALDLGGRLRDPCREYGAFLDAGEEMAAGAWSPGDHAPGPGDVQYLLQTSGTTGTSKSAMLTHESLVPNAYFVGRAMGIEPEDRFINFSPFYHNGGLVTGILMNTAVWGSTLYFQPRFDPGTALEVIDEHGIESMFGFGTMYAALRDAPTFEETEFTIEKALVAATPSQYDAAVAMSDAPPDERTFANLYAQTEGGPLVSVVDADDPDADLRKYSNGQPLPGIEVVAKDPETGDRLPPGEAGELCYRGWSVFEGYYQQPERTAAGWDEEGYWHSGDYGRVDGGYVYFDGRLDDVVKTGGENVSTRAVETFLGDAFDDIADVAVVGVPDDYWGQRIVAFIEYAPGAEPRSAEEWRAACKDRIADYRIPRNFFEIDEWPTTETGKIVQESLEAEARSRIDGSADG
ncbi:class I adenylate-forming enzyme family protein [Haloglomus litoreum]|uniref:class I adenylate-forming enzyme family protein n=1 Tax=Haloglomus litoreum TaxID=3034026 RepID=UPI0023E763BF|nr:class I adenylate-forming enzyme family protein [Haloglomus sp. DT116]